MNPFTALRFQLQCEIFREELSLPEMVMASIVSIICPFYIALNIF
jgi:hypothetical protein